LEDQKIGIILRPASVARAFFEKMLLTKKLNASHWKL